MVKIKTYCRQTSMLVTTMLITLCIVLSCNDVMNTPKPRMFPKIEFPSYRINEYKSDQCPYQFNYPDYFSIVPDSIFLGEKNENPCWLNLEMPIFNGTLHCSYYPLTSEKDLKKYIEDSYKLAREHQKRANYIDEFPFQKPSNVYGIIFNIEGAAASPFQFYLTDSTEHFFRASLYFNAKAKPDSIAPIAEFVKKDLMDVINSFSWSTKKKSTLHSN